MTGVQTCALPICSIEAKVVQDADRLEAIGAVGLARCLMLSGAMGHSLYVESDPFCENRTADDRLSAVDHFFTKLMKIETLMQTESGRTEARQRTKFLHSFLDELRREIAMQEGVSSNLHGI